MKNVMLTLVMMMMGFMSSTTVFAVKPVKPVVTGEKVAVLDKTFDLSGYVFKNESLEALTSADYAYAVPMPEGNYGDYSDVFILHNGNYGIGYGDIFYEFNSKALDATKQVHEYANPNPKIKRYLSVDLYSDFGENPFKNGKKLGYAYGKHKGKTYIIVYGKR